jgi:DNA-nicking Smr family endonuclease
MNFGNILDQWDKQSGTGGKGKKPPAGQSSEPPEPLSRWLREKGVYDKDVDGPVAPETEKPLGRRKLRTKRPDAVLDLHGLTRDEARLSLEVFFQTGKQRGLKKLLIIHGKGNHSNGKEVLGRTVREFIERCPFAGENGHGDAASGGSGVTWVLLKG